MLEVMKKSANRVDITINGSIDADTMRAGLDELLDASQDVSEGRMLYKIAGFSMPTLGAFAVELARLPKLFSLLGRYDKCAVLCDTPWINTAAEIEGALFPGLDIKSFGYDENDAAEAWLAQSA